MRKAILTTVQLTIIAAGALSSPSAVLAQDPVPNLIGSYEGFLLPFIEQDNVALGDGSVRFDVITQDKRSFTGVVRIGLLLPAVQKIKGTIAASGECTCVSSGGNLNVVLRADWTSFGGGAAALTGAIQLETAQGVLAGSLVLLRPFERGEGDPVPLDVRGDFSGGFSSALNSIQGGLTIGIQDGTSNTFSATLRFSSGRLITALEAVGTVNSDGSVILLGTKAGGEVISADLRVRPDPDVGLVLEGTYVIQDGEKLLDAGTINAILIG